jgi:hypothetical protein
MATFKALSYEQKAEIENRLNALYAKTGNELVLNLLCKVSSHMLAWYSN